MQPERGDGGSREDRLIAAERGEDNAEAYIAIVLAQLGHPATLISTLPDMPIGEGVLTTLRGYGVDCGAIRRAPPRFTMIAPIRCSPERTSCACPASPQRRTPAATGLSTSGEKGFYHRIL